MQIFFHQQYVIVCPLSVWVGPKSPRRLTSSSLTPRSWVGSMWLLAITSLETMPWVTGSCVGFMGIFVWFKKWRKSWKNSSSTLWNMCVYTYMYILYIYKYFYTYYRHRFTVTQFKRFRENIPRMQKCLRYLLVGEVSVECIQIWWTSQIKGGYIDRIWRYCFVLNFEWVG